MDGLLPEYRGFLKEGGAIPIVSEGTVGYLKRFNPKVRCVYRKGRYYAVLDVPKVLEESKDLTDLLKKEIFEMDLHRVNSFLHPYQGLALSTYSTRKKDIWSKTLYSALFKGNRLHQRIILNIMKRYIGRFDFDYLIPKPGMNPEIVKALKNKYPVYDKIQSLPVEDKRWIDDAIRIHKGTDILFPELLRGKRILLFDDIMGTGANLFSLSVKLWQVPVKVIYALSISVKNPKEKVWYDWSFESRKTVNIRIDIDKVLSRERYISIIRAFNLPEEILADAIIKREFNASVLRGKSGYSVKVFAEDKDRFIDRFL